MEAATNTAVHATPDFAAIIHRDTDALSAYLRSDQSFDWARIIPLVHEASSVNHTSHESRAAQRPSCNRKSWSPGQVPRVGTSSSGRATEHSSRPRSLSVSAGRTDKVFRLVHRRGKVSLEEELRCCGAWAG